MQVQCKVIDVIDARVDLELPASFRNHRVEVIAMTMDEDAATALARRVPSPVIAGTGRTLGDLVAPVLDAAQCAEAP